jgi:hypothetical protein
MAMARKNLIPLILTIAAICLAETTVGIAQTSDISNDFEDCKTIASDQARLDCFRKLIQRGAPETTMAEGAPAKDAWPLVRTPNPKGGPDAVAITKTADTARSDPDLAGLIIRCQQKPGFEIALGTVRPFPPLTKRDVVFTLGTEHSILHAEASPAGTALILPIDATAFTTGPWRGLKELAVTIKDPEVEIRGVIPLDGLAPALAKLTANCPSG